MRTLLTAVRQEIRAAFRERLAVAPGDRERHRPAGYEPAMGQAVKAVGTAENASEQQTPDRDPPNATSAGNILSPWTPVDM